MPPIDAAIAPVTSAESASQVRGALFSNYYGEIYALACNAVRIKNLENHIPEWYVIDTLLRQGRIAFYGTPREAYMASGTGQFDIYGRPTSWWLTAKNAVNFIVGADYEGLAIIRANAIERPVDSSIRFAAGMMADIDLNIKLNLLHTQNTEIVATDDAKLITSLKAAYNQKQFGVPALFVKTDVANALTGNGMQTINIGAEFIADRLYMLKEKYRRDILVQVGVIPDVDKRERVQSAEIDAAATEVFDFLRCMVDSFNRDAKIAGLPYVMEINAAAGSMYETADGMPVETGEGDNNAL